MELKQDRVLQNVLSLVRSRQLIARGERVLLAISGGLDSTVCAHLLHRLTRIVDFELELVHVDHATRGRASEQEAVWVRVFAEQRQLKLHELSLKKILELEGLDADRLSQDDLRTRRRDAIRKLAVLVHTRKIATAHHADDNAETFLMRAIQGTGKMGLGGIAPLSHEEDFDWIRPLLNLSRDDIQEYARTHRLSWVEDPSNDRGLYLRNRLRGEVLPVLESIRTGSVMNMARAAERVETEETEMRIWLESKLAEAGAIVDRDRAQALSLGWLESWPMALRRRILRLWLDRLNVSDPEVVEKLLEGNDLAIPEGLFVKRSDLLVFCPETDFGKLWVDTVPVELDRRVSLGNSMAWSYLQANESSLSMGPRFLHHSMFFTLRAPGANRPRELQLDWNKLPWPLAVVSRSRLKAPLPLNIDALLTKAKIPEPYWAEWPVVVSRDDPQKIVMVVGLKALDEYLLKTVGRCVCAESLFEERLMPSFAP